VPLRDLTRAVVRGTPSRGFSRKWSGVVGYNLCSAAGDFDNLAIHCAVAVLENQSLFRARWRGLLRRSETTTALSNAFTSVLHRAMT
jgi:hypothetical protein